MTELRSAFRSLWATPLVSLVAILSLALGIGANTAIFSIVDALILRSLPVRHAEQLTVMRQGDTRASWTNPIWEGVRARQDLFDGAFAVGRVSFDASQGGEVDPVEGLFTSARYFDVLGVTPVLGRTFVERDDIRGGGPDGPVAVISHAFWQSRFGGEPDVIGRTLTLSRVAYTIVGVTPASFFGHEVGRTFDVAVPLGTEPLVRGEESYLDRRSTWWMNVFVRLKPGQSVEQASAALQAVQPRIREETIPENWRPQDLESYLTEPLVLVRASAGTSSLRTRYQRPLIALTAVVAFTLLIACGNIANLMLARATARRHEFAVRTALGAPRWRLARQLIGENLLLSAIGAVLGIIIALWGTRVIVAQIAGGPASVFLDVGIDWRMLGFTGLIAVATTLLFGIAPALFASRVAPMEAMKEQSSGRGGSSRRGAFAGTLVLAQVSLSLLLLVAAGLFVRTFASLAKVELGFVPERVLVVNINAQRSGTQPEGRGQLYERVREAALAVPQVSHAALSVITPVSGSQWNGLIEIPGRTDLAEDDRIVNQNYVSPGWFATMGTPVIAGRDFDARDREATAPAVIVNRKFAERYFNGENPVGRGVVNPAFGPGEQAEAMEIVGLVGDAVYIDLREELTPTMYRAMPQMSPPPSDVTLTLRTTVAEPLSLTRSVTAAVTAVDPDLTLSFRPLESYIGASLAQERLIAMLSGFFGVLALLLAALGLYGITSYAVTRRRVELGIRMALGASPGSVIRLVMSRTGALVVGGILLGGLASWWASKFVSSLLFGLAPADPVTIAGAMVVLAAVASVAGWIPARRAAVIDPAEVLREG
ncbi:MAG TPA: ABC transporter permease [Gemmatimonadaceae bacterium]|nr:ABC transporter permease [Gemmatimonadaceae bacterium]